MYSPLKRSFIALGFLLEITTAIAQDATPVKPASFSSPFINVVRSWTATGPEKDPANLMVRPLKDVQQVSQFLDGLGRPIQTVAKQGSMATDPANPGSSAAAVDLVNAMVYDDYGREARKYLPFPANTYGGNNTVSDGLFKLNPFDQQQSFYSDPAGLLKGQGESYFYGKTEFEPSPLNRVDRAYAPGNSWVHDGHGTGAKYWLNTSTDDVKTWTVTDAANGWGVYAVSGVYQAGTLDKQVTLDEQGNQVIEFKDKDGKLLLRKNQLNAVADDGTGRDYTDWLSTYYVYDGQNRLRCVIQPHGVKLLVQYNWDMTVLGGVILNEQCFRYEYDGRNRIVMKKIPGAGEVYMVYDQRNRLVMSQDANLRSQGQWLVTEYENVLNRQIRTGLLVDGNPLAAHQALANNSSSYPNTNSNYTVLTETFYDNYSWLANYANPLSGTYNTSFDGFLQAASNANWPYPQANTVSGQLKGMVTGNRVLVLGTNTYLYSTSFYDAKGRVIQTQSTNITGGTDYATIQYTWSGQPLLQVLQQDKQGANSQATLELTQLTYDNLGRLVKTEKKVANSLLNAGLLPSNWITISENQYDGLGQMKIKTLGKQKDVSGNYTGTPIETLSYDYNIRGWLLGVNRSYLSSASATASYFGMELGYDKDGFGATVNKQYNGNIGAGSWRSQGDGQVRKYDYSYDAINRLLAADFNQYNGSGFDKTAGVDFSVSNLAYDENGNILSMWQKGLKVTGSDYIDQLKYDYIANTNKLLSVTDFYNNPQGTLGDFKTAASHPQASAKAGLSINSPQSQFDAITDYSYDVNGNLTLDNNKAIAGIVYNHLNLPQQITVAGKGTINYVYDATGNKLQKITIEPASTGNNNTATTTTTTYFGGSVYETKIVNGAAQYTDKLQFLGQEEGRVRLLYKNTATPNVPTGLAYDYFIKDHLGNVRMVLTDEQQQDIYPAATLEGTGASTDPMAIEQNYYAINGTYVVPKGVATGITDYPNNNGNPPVNNNPNCNDNSVIRQTDLSQMLYQLNATTNKTGLGITLKVMSGDRINIYGLSYYFQNNTGGSAVNASIPVTNLISGLLGTPTGVTSGHGTAGDLGSNSVITNALNAFINDPGRTTSGSTTPKAAINWILLDEQFKFVAGNYSPVAQAGQVEDHKTDSRLRNISVTKNGYIYVYVSNESPVNVFFDNLQVIHDRGPILEETHYYPFGLTMSGISSKANKGSDYAENRKKYNGIEETNELGLEEYDAFFRNLDPQTGRWWQIDPKIESGYEDLSPYTSMNDDPIRISDPMGDEGEETNGCCSFKQILDGFNKYVADPINEYINPLTPLVELATGKSYESRFTENKPRLASSSEAVMVLIPGAKMENAAVKSVERAVVEKSVVSLDNNALVAAYKEGGKDAVKKAIGNSTPIVSRTAAKEFLAAHDKQALKDLMKEFGAKISKGGAATEQINALKETAERLGRKVRTNDASIIVNAMNNNARVITKDKKMLNLMKAIGIPGITY